MMKKGVIALLLGLGLMVAADETRAADQKVYRLSFASFNFDRADFMREAMIPWIRELEAKSNGRLQITFYNPGTICAEPEIFDAVETGRVSIGLQNVNRNPGKLPYTSAYCKGMVGSYNGYGSTLGYYNLIKDHPEFLDDFTKFNRFKLLFVYSTPPSAIHSFKPVRTVEDFKGIRILSPGVDGVSQANSVGARGIQMPPADFYMSLQRGMAEGAIHILSALKSAKLEEVVKNVQRVGLSGGVLACVMNVDAYNALPEDLRALIDEYSSPEWALRLSKVNDDLDVRMIKEMEEKDIAYYVFPREERAKWVAACEDGYIRLNVETFKARNLDGEAIYRVAHQYCMEASAQVENQELNKE